MVDVSRETAMTALDVVAPSSDAIQSEEDRREAADELRDALHKGTDPERKARELLAALDDDVDWDGLSPRERQQLTAVRDALADAIAVLGDARPDGPGVYEECDGCGVGIRYGEWHVAKRPEDASVSRDYFQSVEAGDPDTEAVMCADCSDLDRSEFPDDKPVAGGGE